MLDAVKKTASEGWPWRVFGIYSQLSLAYMSTHTITESRPWQDIVLVSPTYMAWSTFSRQQCLLGLQEDVLVP